MQVTDPVCGMAIDSDKALKRDTWRSKVLFLLEVVPGDVSISAREIC
jgi:hypothetical protein